MPTDGGRGTGARFSGVGNAASSDTGQHVSPVGTKLGTKYNQGWLLRPEAANVSKMAAMVERSFSSF